MRNLLLKEYYLILFGGSEENNFEIMANNKDIFNNNNNEVDVLFYYYTTSEKNYNYLVTQDTIKYESKDDFYSINLILPETKKDIFFVEKILLKE